MPARGPSRARRRRTSPELSRLLLSGALLILSGWAAASTQQPAQTPPGGQETASDAQLEATLVELLGQKQFERAIPVAQELAALRERVHGSADIRVAEALVGLARAHAGKGGAPQAIAAYQKAAEIGSAALGDTHADVADILNELGILHFRHGDYRAAAPVFERALRIREAAFGPDSVQTAQMLNNIAQVRQESGDYGAAQPLLERSLAIYEKARGPEHGEVGVALNNLAGLYRLKGDYVRAEPLYRRALAIIEKTDGADSLNAARMLNNLGLMLRDVGNLTDARTLLERSLAIRERLLGSAHADVARVQNNLGVVVFEAGELLPAEALYRRALAGAEPALGERHPLVAQIVNNLAVTQLLLGRYEVAEPLFARAVQLRREVLGNLHPETGVALASQAVLYDLTNRQTEASRVQREATEIGEHNLALTLATGSEAQKLRYVTMPSFAEETDITVSLHRRSAPEDPDAIRLALTTVLRRKGRVLDAMSRSLNVIRDQLGSEDRAALDSLADIRRQQSRLVLRGPGDGPPDAFDAELRRLEDDAQDLEARISDRSQAFRVEHQSVGLDEVRARLREGAVLIEYVQFRPFDPRAVRRDAKFGPPRYAAFVVRPNGEPRSVDIGETADVDRFVDEWRRALRNPSDASVRRRSREAYRRLLGPLAEEVRAARHVYLAPDAALNLVPFAALVDGFGRYLIEGRTISYLTSGRDLLRSGAQSSPRSAPLVIADPEFGGSDASGSAAAAETDRAADLKRAWFRRLPGTGGEAAAIAELLPEAQVLTGRAATESAVKAVRGPRILHVATHGFFLDGRDRATLEEGRFLVQEATVSGAAAPVENPLLRSGLALAGANGRDGGNGEDGILTALEATALDLWGTKLAVLSACETGLGEPRRGDGIYGLRRALVMAGSESQLITLWQVSDTATRDLMTSFYRELGRGVPRAEALQRVQQAMLRQPKRRHPYYWASFILSGADGQM
jgi:CHAT domain-containing protein/Tfp pilus assembly protein PilF